MSNVTIVFHNSLLPYTGEIKKIEMTPDTVYFLFLNSLNLFPDLLAMSKKAAFSKLEDFVFIRNNKCLSHEELMFQAKEGETYYLVPVFKGAGIVEGYVAAFAVGFLLGAATTALQGGNFGQILLGGFISGTFAAIGSYGFGQFMAPSAVMEVPSTFALAGESIVINEASATLASYIAYGMSSAVGSIVSSALIKIKPKRRNTDSIDAGDRTDNNAFDSQSNTISPNQSIPLNYGMVRVAGQIISADVNTVNHGKGAIIRISDYV